MEIIAVTEAYKPPFDHAKLKRMVENYLDVTRQNASAAQRDRDYFDGLQLSGEVRAELAKRGQPAIWTNRIGPSISGVLGIIDSAESDPEAYPRNQSSQDAADVVTKTLRYLADKTDYKKVRGQASDTYIIQGTCAAIIDWDGRDINLQRVRWEDFIHDPLAREHDFEDAKFLGVAKLLDEADVAGMFPETFAALGNPSGDFGNFFDDNSKARWWGSSKRNQVRVIDLYYDAGGDWHRAIFCQTGMLYAGKSEFADDCGCSICPIVATSYEITRAGDRYGAIRNMVPLQDEINARRSRLLHLTNHRQVQQTDMYAPAANKDIARREAGKADGTIPFGWEVKPAPDLAQGQMQILTQSMADLDRMAPTPAVLGRVTSQSESGRARQILQQAGYLELSRGLGRFEAFELSIYRKLWLAARQFLDQPTWIRIMDDPRAPEFLQLNEPLMGAVAKPVIDPQTGQPIIDPATGQPHVQMSIGQVGAKNRIAELDMDIILTTVPDTATLAQEVWKDILEYAGSTGISPFDPHFLALLEMSPIPDKRNTIDKLKRLGAEQQQEGGQAQAMAAKAAMQTSQADVAVKSAKAAKDQAHAAKTAIEATALGASLAHIMPPETIQSIIQHGQAQFQPGPQSSH
jgi:hypothetical protein